MNIALSNDSFLDLKYLASGVFSPLSGFLGYEEYKKVVYDMSLLNNEIWTLPITLEVPNLNDFHIGARTNLFYNNENIGSIKIRDKFSIDKKEIYEIYQSKDEKHPGIQKELKRSKYRVGGEIKTSKKILENTLYKGYLQDIFKDKNIQTIAGFQTRNPIHKAHEHLQRVALELCDALFINPLVGWKKIGDFTQDAVIKAYSVMIKDFYPQDRVHFATLQTNMRYAGPKEAIFHAILRKNLGCTHFIIGRDHAGVGNYYETYAAQDLAKALQDRLDIKLLLLKEPYFCKKCEQIVSDKHCKHDASQKIYISGTKIREALSKGEIPPTSMMRKEISQSIINLGKENIFIKE